MQLATEKATLCPNIGAVSRIEAGDCEDSWRHDSGHCRDGQKRDTAPTMMKTAFLSLIWPAAGLRPHLNKSVMQEGLMLPVRFLHYLLQSKTQLKSNMSFPLSFIENERWSALLGFKVFQWLKKAPNSQKPVIKVSFLYNTVIHFRDWGRMVSMATP